MRNSSTQFQPNHKEKEFQFKIWTFQNPEAKMGELTKLIWGPTTKNQDLLWRSSRILIWALSLSLSHSKIFPHFITILFFLSTFTFSLFHCFFFSFSLFPPLSISHSQFLRSEWGLILVVQVWEKRSSNWHSLFFFLINIFFSKIKK